MATIEEQIDTALDATAASFRRRMAVSDLTRSDDPRAWQAMTQLLDDRDRYLRREVVSSLCRLGGERAIDPLLKSLNDSDDYIRRDAIEGLAKFADARAVDPLRALAADAPYAVRDAAERALEELERRGMTRPAPSQAAEDEIDATAAADAPASLAGPVSEPSTSSETTAASAPVADYLAPSDVADSLAPLEPEPLVETPVVESDMTEPLRRDTVVPDKSRSDPMLPTEPPPVEIGAAVGESTIEAPASPAPGIRVVSAELVAESREPSTALPPVTSSECFLVAVPEQFDWQRAARMRALLGDDLASIAPMYEDLAERQRRLLVLEQQQQEAFMDLGLQRADKEDDLSRCEDSLKAAREELARLKRAATRADRERTVFEAQAKSAWNQLLGSLQSDRNRKVEQTIAEMAENLRAIGSQIAEVHQRVKDLEREHDDLAQPVKQSQARYESLTSQRDAVADEIREIHDRVDSRLLDFLQDLAPDERQSRLDRCGRMSCDPDFFELCTGPLMLALSELRNARAELQTAQQEQQEALSAAQRSLESLGEKIAAGFHVGQVPRRTTIRLKGSLRLNEQHGLFEGYSGADGWASGTGSGEAEYELEEIVWTSPESLPDAVQEFAGTWVNSGRRAARHHHLAAMVDVGRRTVAEFIRFLRSELERDFQETHA
ncbi:MAG: HEAT repeat domain-containing protein [Planctomycetes bacterium]|nr:HEAT repeat domain-containing protein [Planctomycetota bacterium]